MLRTEDHCVGCPDGVPCLGVACPSRNVPVWYCDKCENECSRGELRILDGKQLCYQIRGFFKEICGAMKAISGTKSSKIKAHKKKIDNTIFVEPREIPLDLHGMKMANCQRPLRASTALGERIALANSEVCPEGTSCEFEVLCMVDEDAAMLLEWLEYGKYKGIGQWRNSGKGRFTFEVID